jgi:hypothetical protein
LTAMRSPARLSAVRRVSCATTLRTTADNHTALTAGPCGGLRRGPFGTAPFGMSADHG